MTVQLHERPCEVVPGTTLFQLRDAVKPGADVVVLNGGLATADRLRQVTACTSFAAGRSRQSAWKLSWWPGTPGVHERVRRGVVGTPAWRARVHGCGHWPDRRGKLVLADFDAWNRAT